MTAPSPSQSTPESSNTPNAFVMTDILVSDYSEASLGARERLWANAQPRLFLAYEGFITR
jgi:hypothetical protein